MTGQFGRRDNALEAGQRLMWLEAVWRVTGVDPRELRPHNSDRLRQGSKYAAHASGRRDVLGGDAGRARTHRVRRTEEQDGRWVRDTYPRFEERDGRRLGEIASVRERAAFGSRPAPGSLDEELDQVSVASSSPRESAGEEPLGRDDEYREKAGGPRGDDDGRPWGRDPDAGDGSHAPLDDGDRGCGDDDEYGGPARGSGRVTTLRPGPMARGDLQEPEGQGPHGEHAAQTGPASSSQTADESAQLPTPAEAQAREGGEDNPHEDASQEDAGAWGWGWWNTGPWQSGSSGSGWWNRPEQGNDGDDAWSWWNRGKRAPRSGEYTVAQTARNRSLPTRPRHSSAI